MTSNRTPPAYKVAPIFVTTYAAIVNNTNRNLAQTSPFKQGLVHVMCQPAVFVESALQVLRNRLKLGAQKDWSEDPAKD